MEQKKSRERSRAVGCKNFAPLYENFAPVRNFLQHFLLLVLFYSIFPLLPFLYNAFFRVCWYFTLFGALYKLKHCRDKGSIFLVEIQSRSKFSRCFPFLSFSFLFLHFPTCQRPLEDDNPRDGWLNPLHP